MESIDVYLESCHPKIEKILRRYSIAGWEPDDLVQEWVVFLLTKKNVLELYDPGKSSMYTYLTHVMRRWVCTMWRQTKRCPQVLSLDEFIDSDGDDSILFYIYMVRDVSKVNLESRLDFKVSVDQIRTILSKTAPYSYSSKGVPRSLLEIFNCIVAGMTRREIEKHLEVARSTVCYYIQNLLNVSEVRSILAEI